MQAGRLRCPYCNRKLEISKSNTNGKYLILCTNIKCDFIVRTKQQYPSHKDVYNIIKKYER